MKGENRIYHVPDCCCLIPAHVRKITEIRIYLAHGTLDKSRTMDHVNMILEAMPQTEVHFMEAGHTSVVESKAEWQAALSALLKKVEVA